MADAALLRSLLVAHTCAQKCMGHAGNCGGCCNLDERDFILGPVRDAELLLERLAEAWGRPVLRVEALIDYEEGRSLFPERSHWQNPNNYPALRVLPEKARRPCRFYDEAQSACSIYELRPTMCRSFECDWLRKVLEVL